MGATLPRAPSFVSFPPRSEAALCFLLVPFVSSGTRSWDCITVLLSMSRFKTSPPGRALCHCPVVVVFCHLKRAIPLSPANIKSGIFFSQLVPLPFFLQHSHMLIMLTKKRSEINTEKNSLYLFSREQISGQRECLKGARYLKGCQKEYCPHQNRPRNKCQMHGCLIFSGG